MNNSSQKTSNAPSKFMKCKNCGTVHIVIKNISDEHPTCKTCGSNYFEPENKGVAGYMPVYCDQFLDKLVYDGVMATMLSPVHTWRKDIEQKYGISFSKHDIQDLANSLSVVGKAMVNSTRESFTEDNFVRRLKGQFKSYLYSKKKRKHNQ